MSLPNPAKLGAHKPLAAGLLAKTSFKPGARYADFNSSTDKVAEYGLGGLVLAGAGLGAAKLVRIGLLAKFGKVLIALLIAGKKLLVVGVVGLFALVKAFFKRGKAGAVAPETPSDNEPKAVEAAAEAAEQTPEQSP
ncbi:MAG: DUF2167 domain-containing protein [Polyangiaceae bacterium]